MGRENGLVPGGTEMVFSPCVNAPEQLGIEEKVRNVCPAPWMNLFINPNGEHGPCCFVSNWGKGADRMEKLGNLWNSKYYREIRYHIERRDYDSAGCNRNCYYLNNCYDGPYDPGWLFENLPERALQHPNFLRSAEEFVRGVVEVTSSPTMVHTALSFACNLKCKICLQRKNTEARLSEETLNLLLRSAADFSTWVFTGGEVFADPESNRLLEHVLSRRNESLCALIITNGIALDGRRLSSVLKYGLPRISFSIGSVDRDAYLRIHGRDRLEVALKNLHETAKVFRERGASRNVTWRLVLMDSNLEVVPKVVETCKRLGIMLELDTVNGPFPDENFFSYGREQREMSRVSATRMWLKKRCLDDVFVPHILRRTLTKLDQAASTKLADSRGSSV